MIGAGTRVITALLENARWAPVRAARTGSQTVRWACIAAEVLPPSPSMDIGYVSQDQSTHVEAPPERQWYRGRGGHWRRAPVDSSRASPAAVTAWKSLPPVPIDNIRNILGARRVRSGVHALRLATDWLDMAEQRLSALPEEAQRAASGRWIAHERRRVMQEAFAALAETTAALREARIMLDKMKGEGVTPFSRALTIYLSTMVDKLVEDRDRDDRSTANGSKALAYSLDPLGQLHHHLDVILSHQPPLDPPLLNTILTAHVRLGTPASTILATIESYIATRGAGVDVNDTSGWPPMMFGIMIQVNRRDGDLRGALQWFLAYRKSRQNRLGSEGASPREAQSSTASADLRGEQEWWDQKALAWPYTAFFDATSSSRTPRAGLMGSRSGLVVRLLACMQDDGVEVPPRLVAAMMQHARIKRKRSEAITAWKAYLESKELGKGWETLEPILEVLKVMRTSTKRQGRDLPLEPILAKIFPGGLHDPIRRNLTRHASPGIVRSLFTQLIVAALSPGHSDFALALRLMSRAEVQGILVTDDMVDAVAAAMLTQMACPDRTAAWVSKVFGTEAVRTRSLPWRRRKWRMYRFHQHVLAGNTSVKHWDLLGRRLAIIEGRLEQGARSARHVDSADQHGHPSPAICMPLARPLARLSAGSGLGHDVSVTKHDAGHTRSSRQARGQPRMEERVWHALKDMIGMAAERSDAGANTIASGAGEGASRPKIT